MKKSFWTTEGTVAETPRRRITLGFAGSIAAGALALGLAVGGFAVAPTFADETASDGAAATASVDEDATLAERVAAQALPSVGSVYAVVETPYQQGVSQGSCEVLTEDGYLLTNYHVIADTSEIQVALDGELYTAELVGSDPTSDVAVLKIDPGDKELVPVTVGDSSAVKIGEWVMTVGTPYGETGSVSSGIVSGLERSANLELEDGTEAYYMGLIQTDAMINSGSSGGALFNADGEFIGMTTMSATASGDWAGMTYAIPSNYAMDIANQIIETGSASHPQLGVSVTSLIDAYYSGSYAMSDDGSSEMGAYVAAVVEGSGSDEAGIEVGDVITAVDGVEVYSSDELIIQVRAHAIGDTVTLSVSRDGETLEIPVVLGSDADTQQTADESEQTRPGFGGFGGWGGWSGWGQRPGDAGQGYDGWGFGFGGGNWSAGDYRGLGEGA